MEAEAPVAQTRKAPNKAARVVLVIGIIIVIAIVNRLSNVIPDTTDGGRRGKTPFKLPFAAKEIQAREWLNTDGKTISMGALKGEIILLEFWRFGCHMCQQAIPYVKRLEEEFGERGVKVLTVHAPGIESGPEENNTDNLRQFVSDNKIEVPIAVDDNRSTMDSYRAYSYPTFFIINRNGKVVFQHSGVDMKAMSSILNKMLAGETWEKQAAASNAMTVSEMQAKAKMLRKPIK